MPTAGPWQPTGSAGVAGGDDGDAPRCGTLRATMRHNPLLAKAELGKVKPSMFNQVSEDHVFGYSPAKDAEGAREVTMMWKEHQATPADATGKPTPDFKHMNKTAVKSGLTTAKQLPAFRAANMTTIKKFDHTQKSQPRLPSDADKTFTYGKPSSYRNADTMRQCGPVEPAMKHLIQGAYQDEWIRSSMARDTSAQGQGTYIPPVPTRAVIGHAIGAQKYLQPHHAGEEWKMSKFRNTASRVTQFMGKTAGGATVRQQQYEQQYEAAEQYEPAEQYDAAAGHEECMSPQEVHHEGQFITAQ